MSKTTDFIIGCILIILIIIGLYQRDRYLIENDMGKKIDKIYSILDPDKVETQIQVINQ